MNSTVKTIMFWVFILICLMLLWGVVSRSNMGSGKDAEVNYSDLLSKIDATAFQDCIELVVNRIQFPIV